MKPITNIHVSAPYAHEKTASAGWEQGGCRFHVWFNIDTLKVSDRVGSKFKRVIYKNCARDIKRGQPGYFDPRFLNGDIPKNAATLAHVFEYIGKHDLINKAIKEREDKLREQAERNAEENRIERIKEAGPALYAALELIAERGPAIKSDSYQDWQEKARQIARDAIDNAVKEPQ